MFVLVASGVQLELFRFLSAAFPPPWGGNAMTFNDLFELSPRVSLAVANTGLPSYDFEFRRYLTVRSLLHTTDAPLLLRIGAIADYQQVQSDAAELGFRLLQSTEEHNRASLLPCWYPFLEGITPRSIWFDQLPTVEQVEAQLAWPIFIKGTRQTSRHKANLSIANNALDFARILRAWTQDPILHWQGMVCRQFVPLQSVGVARPGELPPSLELRCFLWQGKVASIGRYWAEFTYPVAEDDLHTAKTLATKAGALLQVPFLVVDVAKTLEGGWIVIECNDAQECGYSGVSALQLWQTIQESC